MKRAEPRLSRVGNDHWSIPSEDSPLINQSEAQKYLGIGRTAFEKYVRPRLTDIKIGQRTFFIKVDLDDLIARMGGKSSKSPWRWKK